MDIFHNTIDLWVLDVVVDGFNKRWLSYSIWRSEISIAAAEMIPDRRARASAINGLETKSWVVAPLCLQIPDASVRIQASPALFDPLSHAASDLQTIIVFLSGWC